MVFSATPSSARLATMQATVQRLGQRRVNPSVYLRPIAQPTSSRPATRSRIQSIEFLGKGCGRREGAAILALGGIETKTADRPQACRPSWRRESEGRNGPAGDVAFAVDPGDQVAQVGGLATQEAVALRVDDLGAEHEQDIVLEPRWERHVPELLRALVAILERVRDELVDPLAGVLALHAFLDQHERRRHDRPGLVRRDVDQRALEVGVEIVVVPGRPERRVLDALLAQDDEVSER